MERKTEPVTDENWAWIERHRFTSSDYYAMEFAELLARAKDDISALTKQVEEAREALIAIERNYEGGATLSGTQCSDIAAAALQSLCLSSASDAENSGQ